MIHLKDGTVIPTEITRHATHEGHLTVLPDGRRFAPALIVQTDEPCSRCAADGSLTIGGYTPRLARRSDDGFVGCVVHDGDRLTGMTEVHDGERSR